MEKDISAQELHDRATRGEALSAVEQTRLETWYAQQDALETSLLNASSLTDAALLTQIRVKTEAALAQVQSEAQRLQALAEENEALRRENAALALRLTQTNVPQAA